MGKNIARGTQYWERVYQDTTSNKLDPPNIFGSWDTYWLHQNAQQLIELVKYIHYFVSENILWQLSKVAFAGIKNLLEVRELWCKVAKSFFELIPILEKEDNWAFLWQNIPNGPFVHVIHKGSQLEILHQLLNWNEKHRSVVLVHYKHRSAWFSIIPAAVTPAQAQ
jgi:hypothetical protein